MGLFKKKEKSELTIRKMENGNCYVKYNKRLDKYNSQEVMDMVISAMCFLIRIMPNDKSMEENYWYVISRMERELRNGFFKNS